MATGVAWSRGALLGLLVIILASCRLALQTDSPSVIPSASEAPRESSTQPSAFEPTASPPPPVDAGWRAIPVSDESGVYSGIVGAADWTDGLIAYGRDDKTHGGIWFSEDGTEWQAAAVPDSPPGTVVLVADVVRVGGRYLAFGTLANPEGSGPMGAVLWASNDGRSWAEISHEVPGGLVAVNGETILLRSLHDLPGVDDMHISRDGGSSWSAVTRPDPWHIGSAIVYQGGYLLGGGLVTTSVYEPTAAIWTSGNGTDWGSRVDLEGKLVTGFATLPDGTLVAVGASEVSPGDVGPVWTSTDGRSWTLTSRIGKCCVNGLASTPQGIVGVGYDTTASNGPLGLVATTSDGESWSVTRELSGTHLGVTYSKRFGIVISGMDPDGRPAVFAGWPFAP